MSPQRDWAHSPTTDFEHDAVDLAILPIYGYADHKLGLGWNAEEVVGGELLDRSLGLLKLNAVIRVLPPLRLSVSPYHAALNPVSARDLRHAIDRIAAGVQFAGARRLAFWSTNPWNAEAVDVASRDIRIERDISTYVIEMSGLGLSLHPRSDSRATLAQLVAELTGTTATPPAPEGKPTDTGFRPGNWSSYPPVNPDDALENTGDLLDTSARTLAKLWVEILNRTPLSGGAVEATLETAAPPHTATTYPPLHLRHYLGTLTPEMTANAVDQDPLVIIPVGAVEQHGAHLPVGVDAMIAETAAQGLAERLGDRVLVAPTQVYGKSNEHHDFAGTIDLGADLLETTLTQQVTALRELGFTKFAVLNTHGGNSSVLVYTLRSLQVRLGIRIGMLRLSASDELSEQEHAWGFHAGEWETSVMLAIAPESVHMDKAVCHYPASIEDPGDLRPENAPAIFSWKSRDISPSGVMGDATRGSADKGKRWFSTALDRLAEDIRKLS